MMKPMALAIIKGQKCMTDRQFDGQTNGKTDNGEHVHRVKSYLSVINTKDKGTRYCISIQALFNII